MDAEIVAKLGEGFRGIVDLGINAGDLRAEILLGGLFVLAQETVVPSPVDWMRSVESSGSFATCSAVSEKMTSSRLVTERPSSPARTNMPRLEAFLDSGGTVP